MRSSLTRAPIASVLLTTSLLSWSAPAGAGAELSRSAMRQVGLEESNQLPVVSNRLRSFGTPQSGSPPARAAAGLEEKPLEIVIVDAYPAVRGTLESAAKGWQPDPTAKVKVGPRRIQVVQGLNDAVKLLRNSAVPLHGLVISLSISGPQDLNNVANVLQSLDKLIKSLRHSDKFPVGLAVYVKQEEGNKLYDDVYGLFYGLRHNGPLQQERYPIEMILESSEGSTAELSSSRLQGLLGKLFEAANSFRAGGTAARFSTGESQPLRPGKQLKLHATVINPTPAFSGPYEITGLSPADKPNRVVLKSRNGNVIDLPVPDLYHSTAEIIDPPPAAGLEEVDAEAIRAKYAAADYAVGARIGGNNVSTGLVNRAAEVETQTALPETKWRRLPRILELLGRQDASSDKEIDDAVLNLIPRPGHVLDDQQRRIAQQIADLVTEEAVRHVVSLIRDTGLPVHRFAYVHISFPGPVDSATGRVGVPYAASNVPGFENYPLAEKIQQGVDDQLGVLVRVKVENDAPSGRKGETSAAGTAAGIRGVVSFIWGTGMNAESDTVEMFEIGHGLVGRVGSDGLTHYELRDSRKNRPALAKGEFEMEQRLGGEVLRRYFQEIGFQDGADVTSKASPHNPNLPEQAAARWWIVRIGENLGRAVAALLYPYYRHQGFIPNRFVLISGVAENFGKGLTDTKGRDLLIGAVQDGLYQEMVTRFNVDQDAARRMAAAVVRTTMDARREYAAAADGLLESEDLGLFARDLLDPGLPVRQRLQQGLIPLIQARTPDARRILSSREVRELLTQYLWDLNDADLHAEDLAHRLAAVEALRWAGTPLELSALIHVTENLSEFDEVRVAAARAIPYLNLAHLPQLEDAAAAVLRLSEHNANPPVIRGPRALYDPGTPLSNRRQMFARRIRRAQAALEAQTAEVNLAQAEQQGTSPEQIEPLREAVAAAYTRSAGLAPWPAASTQDRALLEAVLQDPASREILLGGDLVTQSHPAGGSVTFVEVAPEVTQPELYLHGALKRPAGLLSTVKEVRLGSTTDIQEINQVWAAHPPQPNSVVGWDADLVDEKTAQALMPLVRFPPAAYRTTAAASGNITTGLIATLAPLLRRKGIILEIRSVSYTQIGPSTYAAIRSA